MDGRPLAFVALVLAGCGPSGRGGVVVDGSSTVFPIVNILAEEFGDRNPGVKVVANKCGTGSGFQKFARGEIDVAAASRPIEPREAAALREAGIAYVEIPIAYDGVTVIVNLLNPVRSMTTRQLGDAWSRAATDDWGALGGRPGRIAFYGPTDNHGTHEVFAEAISGRRGELRRDVQTDQDYNVVVRSVADDRNGMGYVGFDYYSENRDRIKAVAVDGVLPTEASIADGAYKRLARPLYLYVSRRALRRPEVRAFLTYALGPGGRAAVVEARYVPLPPQALEASRRRVAAAG